MSGCNKHNRQECKENFLFLPKKSPEEKTKCDENVSKTSLSKDVTSRISWFLMNAKHNVDLNMIGIEDIRLKILRT